MLQDLKRTSCRFTHTPELHHLVIIYSISHKNSVKSNELTVPGIINLPNSNYQIDITKSEKLQRRVMKMINEQKALFMQGEKNNS